jgi:hypothetical protein
MKINIYPQLRVTTLSFEVSLTVAVNPRRYFYAIAGLRQRR